MFKSRPTTSQQVAFTGKLYIEENRLTFTLQANIEPMDPMAVATEQATTAIPIADPVATGLVASLAHPAGNVTGLSVQNTDLAGKHLALLHDQDS